MAGATRLRRPASGSRTRVVLAVTLILLVALAGLELGYLARGPEDTPSPTRPVVTGELAHRAATEAAAGSTEEILSTSYHDYEEQVGQATERMTDSFAEEYRRSAEGIADRFVARRTEVQVEAVAQGVVRASADEVQALVFLNQLVRRDDRGRRRTGYAQYRALVTVEHTDAGWLVSDLETR